MARQSCHRQRPGRRRTCALAAAALIAGVPGLSFAQDCAPAPDPVLTLAFESRYTDDSATRSDIDPDAEAETEAALQPLDDFIRDLADLANQVYAPEAAQSTISDCVVSQLAVWARADALATLSTETAQLTVGSRLAGIGMILRQVAPHAAATEEYKQVLEWLTGLAYAQMTYWEDAAPDGARRGNLRAWAALGLAAISDLTDDAILRAWATVSTDHVLCTAAPDGSLPQEMTRGRLAYHYQLHAVAPLVVTTRLLNAWDIAPGARCDDALNRIVGFVIDDLADGNHTQNITGEVQSYFDGSREISSYNLAWLEAYLAAPDAIDLEDIAARYRPLGSSKLGGDQSLIWRKP
ncbi:MULTISPECIES: alginate lyase family protein [unclassified Marinovum]